MKKPRYLHEQIRQQVIKSLESYHIGDKLPTDRDLAKKFNVAFLTINKVVKELEKDGYFTRQQGKGTFLVSKEKTVHRNGKDKNGTILMAYPDHFSYEYWLRTHIGGELAIKNAIGVIEFKQNEFTDLTQLLEIAENIDDLRGILIDPVPGILSQDIFKRLDALNIPVIIFSHTDWVSFSDNIFSIVPDWFQSGYLRAKTMFDFGYTDLAYIENEPEGQDGGQMISGIKKALKEQGLKFKDLIRVKGHVRPWQDSCEAAYYLTRELFQKDKPNGIIYDSAAGALAGIQYLLESNIKIPEDVGIIANGYLGGLENHIYPSISTVISPIRNEMEKAFNIILKPEDAITHQIICQTELQIRGSLRKKVRKNSQLKEMALT